MWSSHRCFLISKLNNIELRLINHRLYCLHRVGWNKFKMGLAQKTLRHMITVLVSWDNLSGGYFSNCVFLIY